MNSSRATILNYVSTTQQHNYQHFKLKKKKTNKVFEFLQYAPKLFFKSVKQTLTIIKYRNIIPSKFFALEYIVFFVII